MLTVNLLEIAEKKNIIGEFCVFRFEQDGKETITIGQINSIELRNPYVEKHTIQKIISVRTDAPPLTGQHDVRIINMSISAVYSLINEDNYYYLEPTNLGTLPPTGTKIYLLKKELVEMLFKPYEDEIFYIGTIYNSNILLPTIFKHFGQGTGGLGEAYHIGIFGKTGSGKSYLAKMIVSAYSRHREMSILIIDPQGEFSKDINDVNSPMRKCFDKYNRCYNVYNISQLSLESTESFERILKISNILREMGIIAEENQEDAIRVLRELIFERGIRQMQTRLNNTNISINNCYSEDIYLSIIDAFIKNIERVYRGEKEQQRVRDILTRSRDNISRSREDSIYNLWRSITILFSNINNRIPISQIIKDLCDPNNKRIVVLNLSEVTRGDAFWNESVLYIVLKEIINALVNEAGERFYKGKTLNLLVCIDEAHRFVPREKPTNEEREQVKLSLVDAVRTTRKYGLGWLFISQTIASLDTEILQQLRLYFFGYGLSWGSELRTLKEIVGGGDDKYINVYQNFKDPQTSAILGKREFPFMAYGPASLLSTSGAPVFFTALNYYNEFLTKNKLDY
jgi:energy-coupling factor transporter ATP-binding protein EcfA2